MMKYNESFNREYIMKAVRHCVYEDGCSRCPYEFAPECASIEELLYYIDELTGERERCLNALSELSDNIGLLKDKTKTDTVQKMTEILKRRLPVISQSVFDHIARAVLEEEGNK